jgi:hypothetical protein
LLSGFCTVNQRAAGGQSESGAAAQHSKTQASVPGGNRADLLECASALSLLDTPKLLSFDLQLL